jgi:hypothetical protein
MVLIWFLQESTRSVESSQSSCYNVAARRFTLCSQFRLEGRCNASLIAPVWKEKNDVIVLIAVLFVSCENTEQAVTVRGSALIRRASGIIPAASLLKRKH